MQCESTIQGNPHMCLIDFYPRTQSREQKRHAKAMNV